MAYTDIEEECKCTFQFKTYYTSIFICSNLFKNLYCFQFRTFMLPYALHFNIPMLSSIALIPKLLKSLLVNDKKK